MSGRRIIWILKCRRAGDLAQLRNLAALLLAEDGASWEVEEKQLVFRASNLVRFPAAAHLLFDGERSDSLEPPWPDLVLAAEAVASHVARLVKERSGGKTKIAMLGRPAGEASGFDLVLTTAQYDLPPEPNVVRLPLPLAKRPMATDAGRRELMSEMGNRPRPWTAMLVGGAVAPDRFDEAALVNLAAAVRDDLAKTGGSAIVLTSPRTGASHEKRLRELMPEETLLQGWSRGQAANLYGAALAEADRLIVTSDSISMATEAIDTGKPVSVFMLPQHVPPGLKLLSALNTHAGLSSAGGNPLSFLFSKGILEAPPDRQKFFRELIECGEIAAYPEFSVPSGGSAISESGEIAVAAIGRLFA